MLVLFSSLTLARATQTSRDTEAATLNRPRLIKAFVVDGRLSALRREANAQSEIINRLRLARPVYIIESKRNEGIHSKFCRVAITRRTRGWILASALVVPGRTGEDERVLKLIESADDEFNRITLCKLFVENFSRSPLTARVLLRMGEEAERVAATLTGRARRRLGDVDPLDPRLKDYYQNDAGLDRYSRIRVVFSFDEANGRYVYDGRVYREINRRFPGTEEARIARKRLEVAGQKSAHKE